MINAFRNSWRLALGLAGSALWLTACSPSYYVLVKPSSGAARWEDGLEVVAAEVDSVDVRLGVASTQGPWLEFAVTVRNRSLRPVLVAPETFYYDAYTAGNPSPLRVTASNPEEAIQALQAQTATQERQATAVPAAEVLSSLSNLVDDLSSKKRKETPEQREAREETFRREQARYEEVRTQNALQAVASRDQLRSLEQTLLRKTTLDPGYVLHGRIRFRRYTDAATRLRVVVPVGGRELAGDFTQTRLLMDGRQLPTAASNPR
ncbi:hypothetical protein [Hymenobacter sp. B81]|uniref:hypothetical protein n=1 Tax=Hymenobacter sp. B81 TaxID=3344878 RepID=UPI0037DC5DE0